MLSDTEEPWLKIILTLALSIGAIGLILQLEGQLGIRFTVWGVTLPYLALMLPGWWLWRQSTPSQPPPRALTPSRPPPRAGEESGRLNDSLPVYGVRPVILLLAIIAAAILFNAAYWPFYLPDARAIYKVFATNMYLTQGLLPLRGEDWYSYYQAYPMLVPLNTVYVYLISGWENEYLAKVLSTLLSLGCIPAVYVLGTMLHRRSTGLLAALLLATTPTFAQWSSSGYVDLPMAFFYTLSAVFAWRLLQQANAKDAILTGLIAGLAALTKNAGLISIGLLIGWLGLMWIRRRIALKYFVVAASVGLLIPAPWYIRNIVEAGLVFPPTAWTDQARHSLSSLLIFIARPEIFLVTGWLICVGVLMTLYDLVNPNPSPSGRWALLLFTLTIPFFIIWWWLVSYDPRFLLLFLPLLCVMAAIAAERIWQWLPHRERLKPLLLLAAIGLSGYMLWISVDYKEAILRNPLMDGAAKQSIVLSPK